jgi:hypothetical protein
MPSRGSSCAALDEIPEEPSHAPTRPFDSPTSISRDYTSIAPQLKQVFFVGDGRRSNGKVHQIVVS